MSTEGQNTGLRDKWTYRLAVMVMLAFFVFFGIALIAGVLSDPKDYDGVEKVASTLGAIAAAVIGYYFGQRPVQNLAEQVKEASSDRDRAQSGLIKSGNAISDYEREIEKLKRKLQLREDIIERLNNKLEESK